MESKPVKYIQVMCSTAHTYGNAVAFIEKWLIDLFPKKDNGDPIFKTISVSSKIAHRQIRRSSHEISKNTKPILAIRPRIDFSEDRFLQGTPLTDRLLYTHINFSKDALQPFFFDDKNRIAIKYQLNRTVMYVDVTLVFPTMMQQLNYMNFLKNTLPTNNSPFDLNTVFESYLSQDMMKGVAQLAGIPFEDENGSVKNFIKYMNGHSNAPITYKLQGSTGTREFYRCYPVKIITQIQSIDADDGDKSGQVTDDFRITFPIRMEFYTTGFYFLFSEEVFSIKKPSIDDNAEIIPVYTDVLLREDWDIQEGWCQYNRATCRLSEKNDKVNFKEMLSPSIQEAIRYYNTHGLYMGEIVDIRIRKQGNMIFYGKDYDIDFDNLDIKFKNDEYGFYTYTIMICINPENINNLIKDIFKLK